MSAVEKERENLKKRSMEFLRHNYNTYPSVIEHKREQLVQDFLREKHQVVHCCRFCVMFILMLLLLIFIGHANDSRVEYWLSDSIYSKMSEGYD